MKKILSSSPARSALQRVLTASVVSAAGLFGLPQLASAAICPTTASTNSDCGYVLTIGAGDVITGALVSGATPYDGSDDALIGIVNNSGAVFTGSFVLSGQSSDGGLFAFEGDGICTLTTCNYPHPTGYEGPIVTFSKISADLTTGTVNVAGLGAGASTYFSLEGSPAGIADSGGIGVPPTVPAVPEPGTWALMGLGLALTGWIGKRRTR